MGYPSMPFSPSDIASVMAAYSMSSSSNPLSASAVSSGGSTVTSAAKGHNQTSAVSSARPSSGGLQSPVGSSRGARWQINNGDEISSRRSSSATPGVDNASADSRETPLSHLSQSPATANSQVRYHPIVCGSSLGPNV